MKCKLSSYVVKHNLTTLKYNNISQVCPYKDLGNAKDYIIILLFFNATDVSDKSDKCRVKEAIIIYYAQIDYNSKPRGKGTVRFAVSAPFVATNQSKYRRE